jgi:hypothetical protein
MRIPPTGLLRSSPRVRHSRLHAHLRRPQATHFACDPISSPCHRATLSRSYVPRIPDVPNTTANQIHSLCNFHAAAAYRQLHDNSAGGDQAYKRSLKQYHRKLHENTFAAIRLTFIATTTHPRLIVAVATPWPTPGLSTTRTPVSGLLKPSESDEPFHLTSDEPLYTSEGDTTFYTKSDKPFYTSESDEPFTLQATNPCTPLKATLPSTPKMTITFTPLKATNPFTSQATNLCTPQKRLPLLPLEC